MVASDVVITTVVVGRGMIARCGDMTDRLLMDQPGAVVQTRGHNYRCRGNMMTLRMRWALVGRQRVVVVRGGVWVVIKGDGNGMVGSG